MNNWHHLHRDVLNEGSPADFEQAVLAQTIRTARRVRRTHLIQRCAAVAGLIAAFGALQMLPRKDRALSTARESAASPATVASSHTVLRSTPFSGVIRSVPLRSNDYAFPTSQSLAILRTSEANPPELIPLTDDQLLSFFPGQAVALVGRGTGHAELILLDQTSH